MKQVIPGGYYDLLNATTVEYNTLVGATWNATENRRQHCASPAGTLSRLVVELNDSPGVGKSYTFVVMKNGVATDLAVTIADAATEGSNTANSVSISGGDTIGLRCTPSGTPTARYATWSVQFEGTTAKQSWIPEAIQAYTTSTMYSPVMHGAPSSSATENDVRQIIPTAGKIRNLYVSGSTSPGGNTKTYRFTLRKGGVSTTLTCDMVGDATTANDTTNEVTVAAGDVVTLMVQPVNSPSAYVYCAIGFTFVADTDGESIVMGGGSDDLSATATEYNHPSTSVYNQVWGVTEATKYQGGQPTTFKKLYVLLSGTPGAGTSYTIGVRVNGSTKLSVTIADTATTGNDTVNSFTLSDHDVCNMICTPSGTPTVRAAYWGFVGYIESAVVPTAILEATSSIQSTSAQANGKISDDGGALCQARFGWGRKALAGGLVGHWKLNEDPAIHDTAIIDSSLKGNNGTLSTGDGATNKSTTGRIGKAIQLDGTNDYIDTKSEFAEADGLFAAADKAWTVSVWAKVSSGLTGTVIARAGATTTARTFQMYFGGSTLTPSIYIRGTQTNTNKGADDGNWHHHVVTWDGTNARYYVDAGSAVTLNVGTATEETGQRVIIGARTNGTGYHLNGAVDDVRIFDRVLSAAEIAVLYNSGSGTEEGVTLTDWQPETATLDTDDTYNKSLTGLTEGTDYVLETRAKNSAGEGAWTASGYFRTHFTKVAGGAVTSSSALVRKTKISATGAITSIAGSLSRKSKISTGGVVTSAAALGRSIAITIGGAVTSSGVVSTALTIFQVVGSGAVAIAGTLGRKVKVTIVGAVTSAGSIGRSISIVVAGAITPVGGLLRKTKISLSGVVTSAGSLGTNLIAAYRQAVGGVVTIAGSVALLTKITLSGAVTSTGSLGYKVKVAIGGAVTSASSLGRKIKIQLSSNITPTGALGVIPSIIIFFQTVGGGAVASASTLGRKIKVTVGGSVAISGRIIRAGIWLVVRLFTRAYHKVTLSTRDY